MRSSCILFLINIGLLNASTSLYEGKTTAVVEFDTASFTSSVEKQANGNLNWIVVFYAHWCGHCQHFAPEFIRIAESFRGSNFKFGAIDCAALDLSQKDACASNNIRAYPTVLVFKGGEKVGELAKTPDALEKDVKRLINGENVDADPAEKEALVAPPVPIDERIVTPETVMADAKLALYTILKSEVFRGNTEELSTEEKGDLVKLLSVCSSIFERETACESIRSRIVSSGVPSKKEWIQLVETSFLNSVSSHDFLSCKDFSCGMWRLLHLMSVSGSSLGTARAMESIRFVVEKYFSCEACRVNFLEHYDNCDFGRCSGGAMDDYVALAAWLVRVHNGINSRLGHPVWPDESPRTQVQYANAVLLMYGKDLFLEPAPGSRSLWMYVGILLVVLVALTACAAQKRDLFGKLKFSLDKKYQPINIV